MNRVLDILGAEIELLPEKGGELFDVFAPWLPSAFLRPSESGDLPDIGIADRRIVLDPVRGKGNIESISDRPPLSFFSERLLLRGLGQLDMFVILDDRKVPDPNENQEERSKKKLENAV